MKNAAKWLSKQCFAKVGVKNKVGIEAPVDIKAQVDIETGQPVEENDEDRKAEGFIQWMTSDDRIFSPASKNVKKLKPGFYEIGSTMQGLYFEKVTLTTEDLVEFPETTSQVVIDEIEKFWEEEKKFRQNKLAYKRGILLYGPPGSGKTCTIKMILDNIVKRGGIAVKFDDVNMFKSGMRVLRRIQEDTPVVALMEDVDSILRYNSESEVINILDGMNGVDKVVYLATTNYPEKLGSRIMNRPSRFDRRYFIGMPNAESRKIYLSKKLQGKDQNVEKWVSDTEGMSIAHLKELVVAVTILDNEYDESVNILRDMKKKVDSGAWDDFGDGETISAAIRERKMSKNASEPQEKQPLDAVFGECENGDKGIKEKSGGIDPVAHIVKCSSGWNSDLLPGKFFATKTAVLKALRN
jgi:hypothetical protein